MAWFDQENASQLSVHPQLRGVGPLSAPVGKVFQSNGIGASTLPTPGRTFGGKTFSNVHSATPRRALGDVKNTVNPGGNKLGDNTGLMLKPGAATFQKPPVMKMPAPASKPPRPKQQEKQRVSVKKPESVLHPALHIEPMEKMDIYEDPTDNFEDIWPERERPATYIQQLKDWRPSRLLPCLRSEEDEAAWERSLLEEYEDEEELVSRVANLTVEEPDLDMESLPSDRDFYVPQLPSLDDLFLLDNVTFGKLD